MELLVAPSELLFCDSETKCCLKMVPTVCQAFLEKWKKLNNGHTRLYIWVNYIFQSCSENLTDLDRNKGYQTESYKQAMHSDPSKE